MRKVTVCALHTYPFITWKRCDEEKHKRKKWRGIESTELLRDAIKVANSPKWVSPVVVFSMQMADRHVTICYHRQDTKKVSSVGQTDCSNFGTFASFKVGAGKLQMFLFIQCKGCVERLLMGFSTKVSSLSHNCRNKTAVDHEWGWWLCTVVLGTRENVLTEQVQNCYLHSFTPWIISQVPL